MDSQKQQITERLKQANTVLVTVSSNPSVDQLAGAVGLTLLLNKLGKHATAVFSGEIPSTIEFLQPEKTLEKNTDSLRDFIIALDKSKADKLRYKVEDQMVKIFITPYRTSISDKDLEFSQGDFNVEVVMALGVSEQKDLDQAITAHGRILHDATVIGVSTGAASTLGSLNWSQADASSLCEMLLSIGLELKPDVLDSQMATAFLTGIVAETDRFSNEKTSSGTMQLSAKLMAAGANQQLVASQLEAPVTEVVAAPEALPTGEAEVSANISTEPDAELPQVDESEPPQAETSPQEETSAADGSLQIDHPEDQQPAEDNVGEASEESEHDKLEQIHIDDEGHLRPLEAADANNTDNPSSEQPKSDTLATSRLVLQPPTLGGTLTANSNPEGLDPSTDPLGVQGGSQVPLLSHDPEPAQAEPEQVAPQPSATDILSSTSPADEPVQPPPQDTLTSLEEAVDSPHLEQSPEASQETEAPEQVEDVNLARDAVNDAVSGVTPQILEPVQALNAQPVDLTPVEPSVDASPVDPENNYGSATQDHTLISPNMETEQQPTPSVENPTAPPSVPPPLMPSPMPPSNSDPSSNTPL